MKKILDFGIGKYPYFLRYNLKPFAKNDKYFGADECSVCLEIAKKSFETFKNLHPEDAPEAEFLTVQEIKLSFENNCFDEIILSNVLSAPIHESWDSNFTVQRLGIHQGIQPPKTRPLAVLPNEVDIFYSERKTLVTELLRILKLGGKLTIFTDLIVYGQDAYNRIIKDLNTDSSLVCSVNRNLQEHIDTFNKQKLAAPKVDKYFLAEVLRESFVLEVLKK